ncbi:MAG TPA: cytochrome c oxidase assembly protein [Ktedonobacteraceae bacterium]|jgi:putative membrane protein
MTFDGVQLTWPWSPFSLTALLLFSLACGLAIRLMHIRRPQERPVQKRQIAWFAGGVLLIALSLLTPLDAVARTQLFLAHMFQVVLLTTFAAPCVLFACPGWLLQPVLAWPGSRAIIKLLTQPVVASVLFNATFLYWHLPVVYGRTLQVSTLYHLMTWSLFLVSFLNWWPLIGPDRQLHRLSYPAQIAYAFLDGEPLTIFAFLLVFSGAVFYPCAVPTQFLSAYADQASAGALLLIPGIVDLVVMSPLFFRWLQQMEERARRDDARLQAQLEVGGPELSCEQAPKLAD